MEDSRVLICAEKRIEIRFIQIALLITSLLIITGCYGPMTGTVIDAETGTPIEGAVIAADWSVTKGVPGLTYGKDYKLTEAVTDKDGKFKIAGTMNPFVNPPIIVVYKKGYVAWRNDYIFPSYEKRGGMPWESGQVFRLEIFKKTHSHSRHISFVTISLSLKTSSKLNEAYSVEWPGAEQEGKIFGKIADKWRMEGASEVEIWDEVVRQRNITYGDSASE